MKTDKWLYFRTVSAASDDDGIVGSDYRAPTSGCYPASSIVNMAPTDDNTIRIGFTPIKHQGGYNQYTISGYHATDYVDITIGTNKHKEVMAAINSAATNSRTPFIVIGDEVTGEYIHSEITAIGTISNPRFPVGVGAHEYYEIVRTSTSADADGEVAAQLDLKLPAGAILLEGAITARVLSGDGTGSVRLDYHSASIADAASAAGTEWIGAGSSGTTSIPDADLDAGSGGVLDDSVHSGTAVPVDRGTAETFFQVAACGDISGGTAYIGVYIKWFGKGGRISY